MDILQNEKIYNTTLICLNLFSELYLKFIRFSLYKKMVYEAEDLKEKREKLRDLKEMRPYVYKITISKNSKSILEAFGC